MAININLGGQKQPEQRQPDTQVIGAKASRKGLGAGEFPASSAVVEQPPAPVPRVVERVGGNLSLEELKALVAEREQQQKNQTMDVPYIGYTESLSTDLLLAVLAELRDIRAELRRLA